MLVMFHLLPGLFEQFLLLAKIELILLLFFLLQLLLPLFTFFLATIRTGEGLKLLGIGNPKLVAFLLTLKGDLSVEESVHHLDIMLGRHLFAVVVEFLALIAPIIRGC